jgi:hypothetical protein
MAMAMHGDGDGDGDACAYACVRNAPLTCVMCVRPARMRALTTCENVFMARACVRVRACARSACCAHYAPRCVCVRAGPHT